MSLFNQAPTYPVHIFVIAHTNKRGVTWTVLPIRFRQIQREPPGR